MDIDDQGSDSVSDVGDLKVWEVSSTEELEEIYVFLKSGDHDFETVVLDTLTMLQQIKITELIGRKLEKSHKQPGDWGTMSKSDWGKVAGYMSETILKFRNLDMEVVFLAQQRVSLSDNEDLDEEVIDPEIGPSLSKSVRSKLEAAVNVIGNTVIRSRIIKKKDKKGKAIEKERIEYCLEIGPSSLYIRKVRKPKAFDTPEYIADPEYEDLIDILNGD